MLGVGAFCYPIVTGSGMGTLQTTRLAGALDRQFYAKLLLKLDPVTMGFEFRDGQTRYVNENAVSRILGLKSGRRKVGAGSGVARSRLVEEVQDLLGLHGGRGAGIAVEDLKKVLQICDPDSLNKAESDAAKVAYTLLACVTFLALRQAGSVVPDELLACVVVPDEIGEYNWGEYVLDQLRNAAEKLQLAIVEGAKTLALLGCNPLLQVMIQVMRSMIHLFVGAVGCFSYGCDLLFMLILVFLIQPHFVCAKMKRSSTLNGWISEMRAYLQTWCQR
jgi:hypothetical protein